MDEALRADLSLTLLVVLGGPRIATVAPTVAIALSLADGDVVGGGEVLARIHRAGFELNGADRLFYLPVPEQQALLSRTAEADTRRLTHADAAGFERFCSNVADDDLEEAFVEIDHWLVYGAFARGTWSPSRARTRGAAAGSLTSA